ncbi:sugar-binding domain-containing protein [Echinicola shivajiensis]|uniref:sugar-binding domain-containing protein n=1 Tax=Echinicola shivajiensis TaxID=1035916 RepID=UPI001BFC63E5|nr:sugar-binding domain-containing protein [Echinicola shivajiensis]
MHKTKTLTFLDNGNFSSIHKKKGLEERWFESKKKFNDSIKLPGSTDTNEKGDKTLPWPEDSITRQFTFPKDFENPKWIYELNTAPSRKYKYIGPAWYQKEIQIPTNWENQRAELFFERSLFKMQVWIDGNFIGEDIALYTPRRFDISDFVKPGEKHLLTICIDNTNLIGGMAHSYTYHTQTNWNGIMGSMEIRPHEQVSIKNTRIFTDIYDKNVRVETTVSNQSGTITPGKLLLQIKDKKGNILAEKTFQRKFEKGDKTKELYLDIQKPITLWDEFTPELYTAHLELITEDGKHFDTYTENFGFRKIETSGSSILINDRPVFIRGTLDCAIYPKTGYMPMDRPSWERTLKTIKSYGMNHVRYHSVCPPKVAFEVADELGIYLQAELI